MSQPRRQSGIVSLLTREDAYVSGPQVLSELRRVIASAPGAARAARSRSTTSRRSSA